MQNFTLQTFKGMNITFRQHPAWVKLQLALLLLLLTTLQLFYIPPPLPPPASNSSCLCTQCQHLYASCSIVLLCFTRYCTVRFKMLGFFYFVFIFYVLFVWKVLQTYYSPVLYSKLFSWVPMLNLLDLQIGLMNALSEQNLFICRDLLYISSQTSGIRGGANSVMTLWHGYSSLRSLL